MEQQAQQAEMEEDLLDKICQKDARERLSNALDSSKPAQAQKVRKQLISMAQQGQAAGSVSDAYVKQLLEADQVRHLGLGTRTQGRTRHAEVTGALLCSSRCVQSFV